MKTGQAAAQSLLLGGLLLLGGTCARPAPAETAGEKIERLQESVNGASELGNFARVQTLRLELARRCEQAGRYALAARQYELLLASRPPKRERVKFFVQLGEMRDRLEDYSGAINSYQDALHDDASDWDANLSLARAYAQIGINTDAVETYEKCIRMRPQAQEPRVEIAGVFLKMGYLNRALEEYNQALSLRSSPEIYLGIADCYIRQGDMDQATAILEKGKALVPRADYDVLLGDICRKKGDLSGAGAAWEEALKADPLRDDVRLKLVMIYDRLHRRPDTDRLLRRLTAAYPESPLVHFLKAWVLYDRGDRRASRGEALLAENLEPTETVRHYDELLLKQLQK